MKKLALALLGLVATLGLAHAAYDPPYGDVACILVTVANQSTNNATVTSVTFGASDTTSLLQGMTHSTVSNTDRVVVITPGNYTVVGFVSFINNAVGQRRVLLTQQDTNNNVIDSAAMEQQTIADNDNTYMTMSQTFRCKVGDYITLSAWQNSTGSLNIAGTLVSLSVCLEPGQ